jgi:hypothetical protein
VGDLSRLRPQWGQFVPRQIEASRARHERLGLRQKYLDGLDDFLRDATTLIPVNAAPVILTGEYNPENIFLEERSGRWRLAGLIDFGDVMTGWGEYDLLGRARSQLGECRAASAVSCGGLGVRKRTLILRCPGGLWRFFCFIGSAIWRFRYALRAGNRRPLTFTNWNDCSGRFDGGSSDSD